MQSYLMTKQILIVMLISLSGTGHIQAQWTTKDSVWLQNVLSGKEKLELNTETMEAIESGTLINSEKPASDMKLAPVNKLPILKDFSEYIKQSDTIKRKIAIKDLPPAVMRLYGTSIDNLIPVYQSILDELKQKPPQGYTSGAILTVFFDIGELTSRKSWVHKRNAKRDATWQEYNNLPTPDILKKTKSFIRQQIIDNDSVLNKDTVMKTDSMKIIIPALKKK